MESHFLFRHHFCRIRQPQEKGHVENAVDYSRRNHLVPVPQFNSFDAFNQQLEQEYRDDMPKTSARKKQSIAELFEEAVFIVFRQGFPYITLLLWKIKDLGGMHRREQKLSAENPIINEINEEEARVAQRREVRKLLRDETKKEGKYYVRLPRWMQQKEADFMFNKIIPTIDPENKRRFLPIHDCILVKQTNRRNVKNIKRLIEGIFRMEGIDNGTRTCHQVNDSGTNAAVSHCREGVPGTIKIVKRSDDLHDEAADFGLAKLGTFQEPCNPLIPHRRVLKLF